MFCPKCGKELPEGGMFCPKCGAGIGGNLNTQLENGKSTSGKTVKTVIIMVVITVVLGIGTLCFLMWLGSTDYEQLVKGGKLSKYDYGKTIEESLSDWFGGNVTWDSYEENETVYVTASGTCPYLQEVYNGKQTFIFKIIDDDHFRFEGAYDSDGCEIFTNSKNNYLKTWERLMSIYSDVSIHELALEAAFGDQDSLQIFKNTLNSDDSDDSESEEQETFDEEESVYEDDTENVRYDFLYGEAECELQISLCYQQEDSGIVELDYTDYADENNSINTSGTFEEDDNGNGTLFLDTGDSISYEVNLSNSPTYLTITSPDGMEITLWDYDWATENAG